jgi:hypothetical protein
LNSGWDESWNYIPQVIDSSQASKMFTPDVAECRGARWVQLNLINAYQKSINLALKNVLITNV